MMIIFFTSSSTQNKINRCVGRVVSTFILWLDFTKRLLLIWKGMLFVEVIFLYDCFWFACTLFFADMHINIYVCAAAATSLPSGHESYQSEKWKFAAAYPITTTKGQLISILRGFYHCTPFHIQCLACRDFFLRCSCCLQWKGGGSGD